MPSNARAPALRGVFCLNRDMIHNAARLKEGGGFPRRLVKLAFMRIVTAMCAFLLLTPSALGMLAVSALDEDGAERIFLVAPETGEKQPLTEGPGDRAPSWSPDGAQIAFERHSEDGVHIMVARTDAPGEARALRHEVSSWNEAPRWSPDGSRLIYSVGRPLAQQAAVYELETDEETLWGGGREGLLQPVWARAAEALALALVGEPGRDLTTAIVIVTEDAYETIPIPGGGQRYFEWNVAPRPGAVDTIAIESNDGGFRDIFMLSDADGLVDVSNHRRADWNPRWSPDGQWIAFESFRDGARGVYRVLVETLRVQPVAVAADYDYWAPAWSPDGARIACLANPDGNPVLFIATADGSSVEEAAPGLRVTGPPAWRPEAP